MVIALAAALARAEAADPATPFQPRPGERWLVEVAEVTTRSLTFDDGRRAERVGGIAYAVEVNAEEGGALALRFRSLAVSRPGVTIDEAPRGRLTRDGPRLTWTGAEGSPAAHAWLQQALAAGLPQALGPELLPAAWPKPGQRWVLDLDAWRTRLVLDAHEIVSFRSEGRCQAGPDGAPRLSVVLDYKPRKLGTLALEPGARYALRVEARALAAGWWSEARSRLAGACAAVPAGPGRTRRARIRHEQWRRYSRRRLP